MPTSPEAIILMLATVRIGAIHSVVFAGFGARALGDRIQASGSRLVFTANVTYRKGKEFALKTIVDEALDLVPHAVEHVVVLQRGTQPATLDRGPRHHVGRVPRARRRTVRRARADGGERAGLHPRHVRHDRQAEAGDSHPRRLSGPHRQHGPLVLRTEAGRRLVGDVGHRLDRRPQLHGVRAAHRRLHDRRVRRRARLSAGRTRTGASASRSSASPASSRRRPRCAC